MGQPFFGERQAADEIAVTGATRPASPEGESCGAKGNRRCKQRGDEYGQRYAHAGLGTRQARVERQPGGRRDPRYPGRPTAYDLLFGLEFG